MPRKPKINTNFDDESEDDFYKSVKLMKQLLTANSADFTGLPIAMNAFGTLIVTFDDKRTAAIYPGKGADTSAARTALQTAVTTNGVWLNTFCNGNLTLIKKTGYPVAKESEAQGKLEASVLTLTFLKVAGILGFLISHVPGKALRYGTMYTLADTPDNNPANWTFYYAAQRDGVIGGLESKKDYKMVSFAMGTDKDITYSDPVVMSAQ